MESHSSDSFILKMVELRRQNILWKDQTNIYTQSIEEAIPNNKTYYSI